MHLVKEIEAAALTQARRGLRALHARMKPPRGDLRRAEDFTIPAPYGPLRARYYEPNEDVVRPLILFFHGGGFVCCDIDTHHSVCAALAEASGARIVSVDYRLAPETPFPGQLEDARTSCAWALENAAALGAQEGAICVAGDSAGGYLAARMAAELNRTKLGLVALQILLYPLVHVDDALWAQEELANFRFLGRVASLYIARALGETPMPSLLDSGLIGAPATIVASGSIMDPVCRDVRAYSAVLRGAGVQVTDREYPFLMHGGFNFGSYLRTVDKALREIGALTRGALDNRRV